MADLRRLLIANRGEIAIRIARTAPSLAIETVAVYAEDDESSLHRKRGGRAVPLVGRGVGAYLDQEQLIRIAREQDCDGVHPGYGFLSENASFAARCEAAGLCFIGPEAPLIERLGDKAEARQMAAQSDVPVVPGISSSCSLSEIEEFFDQLGPGGAVMIKALAGGGGRGMRAVNTRAELANAYDVCRKEAEIAFGLGDLYVEQLVTDARHIEVQILADHDGGVVHLWERECTLQRRNQKLIETAPSPTLSESQRSAILEASVRMAKNIGYQGLGTFEFLVDAIDPARFYFLEVNPRIQVEHTVTEEITGLDLVALQLQIASGRSLRELGVAESPPPRGSAIQARVYLESVTADGNTKPASGTVAEYEIPSGPGVRVDDCLYAGYRVNPNYDPMACKLIAVGHAYETALERLRLALRELRLDGVVSNRGLLLNLLAREEVVSNHLTTGFVEETLEDLLAERDHGDLFFGDVNSALSVRETIEIPAGHAGIFSSSAGALSALLVDVGDSVHVGQSVARLEALKMEFEVVSPCAGIVREVPVRAIGELIDEGELLAVVEIDESNHASSAARTDIDLDSIRPDLAEVRSRHAHLLDQNREDAVRRRHQAGLRTARENVTDLLDDGSFNEYGALALAAQRRRHSVEKLIQISPADGLITGTGTINAELFGKEDSRCAVMAYDATVMAGTQGFMNHKKTDRLLALAHRWQLPLVLFGEGGGGRPHDTDYPAVAALDLHTFAAMAELSGLVPTVAIVGSYCFAGNAALCGLCDVVVATRKASLGLAGPAMIEASGLGRFTAEEIGPASDLAASGAVDLLVEDEAEAVLATKRYLTYFQGDVETWESPDKRLLRHAIPLNRLRAYDVHQPIEALADHGSVLELRAKFAPNVVTALVRIEGRALGLFANNPQHLGGAIDGAAADKIARFLQLCDAHDLPVVSLCDTPGFMVGPESERRATLRHVSRIFLAAASMTVPVMTLVLRKSYGLGAMAMAVGGFSRPLLTAAWPSGEFGSMGLEGAVRLTFRRELESIADADSRRERFESLVAEMYERGEAVNAASFLEIDAVIDPAESRQWLLRALAATPRPIRRTGKKRPLIDSW